MKRPIRKVMTSTRRIGYRALRRKTHGSAFGVGLFDKAVADLCKAGEIRVQQSGTPSGNPKTVILLKQKD